MNVVIRHIGPLLLAALMAACNQASSGSDTGDHVTVQYRVTLLDDSDAVADLQYMTEAGMRRIHAPLPWESPFITLAPGVFAELEAEVERPSPDGNLQCEINTDEPATTFDSVPGKRCHLREQVPFL